MSADGEFEDEAATIEWVAVVEGVPAVSRKVRARRRTRPRGKTIAVKRLTRAVLREGAKEAGLDFAEIGLGEAEGAERPRTRAACRDEARPCPWVSCKHHLYLDINPVTGSIKLNFPDLEPWELNDTCALDVAERGSSTLDEIGLITNLTRERIRQLEVRGLSKLRDSGRHLR